MFNTCMDGSNQTAVLVDAKRMYTAQLCDALHPTILSIFENIYSGCVNQKKPLVAFMTRLKESPVWNNGIIKKYTDMLVGKCPWLKDLLAAVFVSHVKVLTSVRLGNNKPHIKLKIPSNETYVHAVLVDVAQELYSNPYLIQQNDLKSKAVKKELVCKCIDNNVRNLLPIKDILQAYMGSSVSNNEFQPENLDPPEEDESVAAPEEEDDVSTAEEPLDEPMPAPQQVETSNPYHDPGPLPQVQQTQLPPPFPPQQTAPQPAPQPTQEAWQPRVQEQAVDDTHEHRTVPLAKPSSEPLYDDAAEELE